VLDLARRMQDRGILPELEIFDTGMGNVIGRLERNGLLAGPKYANLFFGNVATAQPTLLSMAAMIAALPADCMWSFAGIGAAQLTSHAVALALGGGVRTGLEDNLWMDQERRLLATNVDLVARVHSLAAVHGRPMMTSEAFRVHFGLRRW
jgi:3-keto-5-aminohexanoate cleavage enzyme